MAKKITFCCWTTLRASFLWGDARQMQDGPILSTRWHIRIQDLFHLVHATEGLIDWQLKLDEDLHGG